MLQSSPSHGALSLLHRDPPADSPAEPHGVGAGAETGGGPQSGGGVLQRPQHQDQEAEAAQERRPPRPELCGGAPAGQSGHSGPPPHQTPSHGG